MAKGRTKLRAAEWLYRWNLSMSILGIVFTILTFLGVFTLILAPTLATIGLTLLETALLLLALVVVVVAGFGLFLDKIAKFWSAQATVGTVRNPYLVDVLYQKELLVLKYSQLPALRALHALVEARRDREDDELIAGLNAAIRKLSHAVEARVWPIESEERVY